MKTFWEKKEKMLVASIFSFFAECFNPFPNKPWFLCVCSTKLSKTQWEKEKLNWCKLPDLGDLYMSVS